jgi:hypothetical protein
MGFTRTVALLSMYLVTQASLAADQGFYFGLSGGQAKYDFAYERPRPVSVVSPNLGALPLFPAAGVAAIFVAFPEPVFWLPGNDDKTNAFSGLIGYQIFPYVAVELTYADLGTLHEYQPAGPFQGAIAVNSELETTALTVSALATIPLTQRWDVYLRGGAQFANQQVSHSGLGFNEQTTYGSDSLLFGVGTQWNFATHWTARLDFQRYDSVGKENGIGEADLDVWSLGVLFRL